MPKRSPERDLARDLYLQARGKISAIEIGEKLNVNPAQIRKWKYEDKWEEILKKPRRGGQYGNKNAKGHGPPKGSKNAEKHGAYSTPRMESLTPEQRAEIEQINLNFSVNALKQLQGMLAKKADLENRIAKLSVELDDPDKLYVDRVTEMTMPTGNMKYTVKSSAYQRWIALEQELGRTEGRINRLLDSIRNDGKEDLRIEIERDRLKLSREKALGIFSVDPADDEE